MWQVIDGLFNQEQINTIEKYILKDLEFKYKKDTVGIPEYKYIKDFEYFESPQLVGKVAEDNKITRKILDIVTNFLNIGYTEIRRIKCNLQFPQLGFNEYKYHPPHIDCDPPVLSMLSMIYYMNDTDGPTGLFNAECEVIEEVEPKRGRILIMSAYQFHASTFPIKTNMRSIINFNFFPKKEVVWPTPGNEYQTVVKEQDGPAPCP
jgi:hypothetical protein